MRNRHAGRRRYPGDTARKYYFAVRYFGVMRAESMLCLCVRARALLLHRRRVHLLRALLRYRPCLVEAEHVRTTRVRFC